MLLPFRASLLRCIVAGSGSLLLASGCMPPPAPRYVEPPPEAPHAMVLVSTTLASQPGEYVDQTVDVDGRRIALASSALMQRTSAIRVAPGEARWAFASRFYHYETKSRLERVPKSEQEYDSCGRTDYNGRCQGAYRYVTKYRLETVTRTEIVEDGRCGASTAYVLVPARTYRVAYTFMSANQCNVACLDVTEGEAGAPCPPPLCQRARDRSAGAV